MPEVIPGTPAQRKRRVRVTAGIAAVGIASGLGILFQQDDEYFLEFTTRGEYQVERNRLLDKWEDNIPMDINEEIPLLLKMLTKEVQDAGGWQMQGKPTKRKIMNIMNARRAQEVASRGPLNGNIAVAEGEEVDR